MEPMPSPRPRFRVIGKFASAYMPAAYKTWQQEVVGRIADLDIPQILTGPVRVEAVFCVTKPKTSKLFFPRPDLDNYEKSLLDAITKSGRIWEDDTQVVELSTRKEWAAPGHPGMSVLIKQL